MACPSTPATTQCPSKPAVTQCPSTPAVTQCPSKPAGSQTDPDINPPTGEIIVTGVTLNESSCTLVVGESHTLYASVIPSNATNKSVSWGSSYPEIASVNGGKITALKEGTTIVYVTTTSGAKTVGCTVKVCRVTLPLPKFGHGDYATTDGKSCGSAYLTSTCFNSGTHGLWSARQCDGFARYVYYMVNNKDFTGYSRLDSKYQVETIFKDNLTTKYDDVLGKNVGAYELTESNLLTELQRWRPNSYVRGWTSSNVGHSIFVVSYTTSTVTIYHANYPQNCIVEYDTLSYSKFLERMKYYRTYFPAS